jgi:hypothetical protein
MTATSGFARFRSEGAAQVWVRQMVRFSDTVNYLVGYRDSNPDGRSFGISFGHADWVPEGQTYTKDVFPRIIH